MDFHELGERDHELQNPTSAEKILLLGEYLRLDADSRVLDIACGKGGPAIVLASAFGCRIVGVELREAFAEDARRRIAAAGLAALVEVHTGDGKAFPLEPEGFDAALCIGASFVWGTIADAATALVPAVKHGGFVAVGEPYWRRGRQHPESRRVAADDFVPLTQTIERFTAAGVALTGVIASSVDDWDRYESLKWRALEEWLAAHPDEPDVRARHMQSRDDYLTLERELLGWAIFVGRKS